jgi:SAM-dependent methyltransferase
LAGLSAGFSGRIAFGERNDYRIPLRWVTVDLHGADINVDVRTGERLPFPDDSQRVAYSSHTIEHLDDHSLTLLLGELRRVLRPGGHIRLETPDAERIVAGYLHEDDELFQYFQRENTGSLVEGLGLSPAHAERHNALVGLFSCYIERGCHVGVLATREEVDRRLREGDLDAFGSWCFSLQSPEQRSSGGHVNLLYFEKLRRMLHGAGFRDVRRMRNGVTEIPRLSLRWIERPGPRAAYSLYIEATAKGGVT